MTLGNVTELKLVKKGKLIFKNAGETASGQTTVPVKDVMVNDSSIRGWLWDRECQPHSWQEFTMPRSDVVSLLEKVI